MAMKAVIDDPGALVNKETLRTLFAEVVTILNSRPLFASSDDPNDMEALTPSHLLLQRRITALPLCRYFREGGYTFPKATVFGLDGCKNTYLPCKINKNGHV